MSIKFSDNKIFGENFITGKKNIHCSIGFLILHKVLNKNGTVIPDRLQTVSKSYLWQYIYYLRLHNKNHPFFKENVGKGAVSPKKWYNMILTILGDEKTNRKDSVTKNDLYNFLVKLFNSDNKVTIPFLQSINSANELVKDFNSLANTREDIKIRPNVKLVANSNSNSNGSNIKVKINVDLDDLPINNTKNNTKNNSKNLQQVTNNSNKPQLQQVEEYTGNIQQTQNNSQLNMSNNQINALNINSQDKPFNGQVVKPQNTQVVKPPNAQVVRPPNAQVVRPPNAQVVKPPNAQVAKPPNAQVAKPPNAQVTKPPNAQVTKPPNAQVAKPNEGFVSKMVSTLFNRGNSQQVNKPTNTTNTNKPNGPKLQNVPKLPNVPKLQNVPKLPNVPKLQNVPRQTNAPRF